MKKALRVLGSVMSVLAVLACLYACENPADEVADTVMNMASQEDKAQDAVDASHAADDAVEAELDSILEGVE